MQDNHTNDELHRMPLSASPAWAHWFAHVNGVQASAIMADWLSNRGSLTARLVARCEQFRVQRLHQRRAMCLADEASQIGLPAVSKVHEREVILRCDGRAMVYAHTVVPLTASASQWPLFRSLGERSLGTTLFNDPLVERGDLMYARLRPSHPLMRRILAIDELAAVTQGVFSLLARRSVFRRKGSSLLVTEVFLPAITELKLIHTTREHI
ncbi:chorismate lyase [Undibacterium sp. Jales W-56]|uniref:chorismate--pyruvate lyase family protein n=1 Tax=Undibacterium sp. Jales W-56 TaxID=2897325 RepID=UPI0021D2E487|nr:chorismate lyase [Undibacterium sp. Jales W-56]MCU6434723.1 chorismate lyase [Undibacterium sp. Jales W-56]